MFPPLYVLRYGAIRLRRRKRRLDGHDLLCDLCGSELTSFTFFNL
jgi:hypothetical protein